MKDFALGENLAFLDGEPASADELAWDHAMDISGSVYARLKELGMSSKGLADILGVTPGRVSQILKGYPGMSLKMLAKLETALGFRLDGGFSYMPEGKSASATVAVVLPDFGGKAWEERSREGVDENAAVSSSAFKEGVVAA